MLAALALAPLAGALTAEAKKPPRGKPDGGAGASTGAPTAAPPAATVPHAPPSAQSLPMSPSAPTGPHPYQALRDFVLPRQTEPALVYRARP